MFFALLLTISLFITSILGTFIPGTIVKDLQPRTYFPDTPASCPVCQKNYDKINSCAQAAPVLANFTYVIFNPGAFIDVIKCACTDTFQSAFPQCVDCFEKTNQTQWLDTPDLPSVVQGVRNVCALASTLISNVSASASAAEASSASAATAATSSPSASTSSNDALQNLNTKLAGAMLAITIAIATLSF